MAPGSWQSRISALVLLSAVFAGVCFSLVLPAWNTYQADTDRIAEQRQQLARLDAIAARAPIFRARLEKIQRRRNGTPFLLPEHSDALAGAALQERVKQVVQQAGGKVLSSQVLKSSRRDPFVEVALNVRMSLSNATLRTVLYTIESGPPFVTLDRLVISRSRRAYVRRANLARRLPNAATSPLNVTFTLRGFIAPSADVSPPNHG